MGRRNGKAGTWSWPSFFGAPEAYAIHQAVDDAISRIGAADVRVSKSQVGFHRKGLFAATWKPSQYLKGDHPPLVLSVFLERCDRSPRWKQVVEPSKGRFTHHVELWSTKDVDSFIVSRLEEAWRKAGEVH